VHDVDSFVDIVAGHYRPVVVGVVVDLLHPVSKFRLAWVGAAEASMRRIDKSSVSGAVTDMPCLDVMPKQWFSYVVYAECMSIVVVRHAELE
jgi:hypothetical protein